MAALTEEGQKYPQYLSYLQDLMKAHKMTFIENRKFPRERAFNNMSIYLEDLNKKGAKIIIGDFYDYAARSVMCTAYKLVIPDSLNPLFEKPCLNLQKKYFYWN